MIFRGKKFDYIFPHYLIKARFSGERNSIIFPTLSHKLHDFQGKEILLYFPTLSHKRHDFHGKEILLFFPHYLINGMIFRAKKFSRLAMCFDFI